MTRTRKIVSSLLALVLTACFALSAYVVSFAETDTVTETVVVTQIIKTVDNANRTYALPQQQEYTYVLTPKKSENPMPEGTENGKYTIGPIKGATTDANAPVFTLEIDKTKPGVYEYVLEKVEPTPEGDTFSPDSHIFGYKVEVDEKTGELVVIPYICQSGNPEFSKPDENGYPTKLTLPNELMGKVNPTTTTTTTTTAKGASTRTVTTQTYRNGTTAKAGTTSRARWVNTGDENQLLTWVVIIGVAAIGLIVLVLLKRKKDDEEEDNI